VEISEDYTRFARTYPSTQGGVPLRGTHRDSALDTVPGACPGNRQAGRIRRAPRLLPRGV